MEDLEYLIDERFRLCHRIACQVYQFCLFDQACQHFRSSWERPPRPTCRLADRYNKERFGLSSSAEHRPSLHWKEGLDAEDPSDEVCWKMKKMDWTGKNFEVVLNLRGPCHRDLRGPCPLVLPFPHGRLQRPVGCRQMLLELMTRK